MMYQGILLPVFVLVGLTFALLFWSGSRGSMLSSRGVQPNEASATLDDPLQLVMLFYVLIALALPLRQADLVMVMLAWVFVVVRFAAAGVLVSSRGERERAAAYLASALVLLAMWVYFALRILTVL